MAYRKFAADQIFTGYSMLDNGAVLITDESGTIVEIIRDVDAGEGIERFNGILCPGLINCHCHLELSHLKEISPPGTGMLDFLITVINKRNMPTDMILAAISTAEQSMWDNGIVAVGDICNTDHTITVKQTTKMHFHNFVETLGFMDTSASPAFDHALATFSKFSELNTQTGLRHGNSIVPHAPYTVSDSLFGLLNDFGKGSLLTIHNQESEAETEFLATGQGPFKALFDFLKIDTEHFKGSPNSSLFHSLNKISNEHTLILVHNVHTSETDLKRLAAKNKPPVLYWCLCPNANIYINGRLPDIALLTKYNCRLVVGTDSLASNTSLNILDELRTLQKYFPSLGTPELLKWATINGAEALRINENYGSMEKGKNPGIVLIEGVMEDQLMQAAIKRIL